MLSYAQALGAGIGLGIMYALIRVDSPAPPPVALTGLAGMLIGFGVLEAFA
ncbi:DUF1427 family protein [Streptomyces celluloflavus]|uniref:DUF1427 family protein n=2 Tax=Streptomyces TaxID=1883 RepID=A0A4Q9HM89_STRKA|nr:DUF1427 family protein [Streptomyces kasugaensis]MYU51600.1 DUF1427 family protein [Streptomyces sp. SID7805]TBO55110.1 DUF1427 family protein [Streptomyces kasugaensis]WSK10639.1 XapX domain-containing protein [Streptomyces celluloflavus]